MSESTLKLSEETDKQFKPMTSPELFDLLDRIRAAGGDSDVRDQVQIELLD